MAHSKGDWMGQNLIECDYGAWRVQFKYPADGFQVRNTVMCNADCWISVTNGTGPHISI